MSKQQKLQLTDTTMRDGHQSLLATKMRFTDMIKVAPAYAANLPQLFLVECWGGATFDVAYHFVQECPWLRPRALMPNVMKRWLHQLPRQRYAGVCEAGRCHRCGCVPGV